MNCAGGRYDRDLWGAGTRQDGRFSRPRLGRLKIYFKRTQRLSNQDNGWMRGQDGFVCHFVFTRQLNCSTTQLMQNYLMNNDYINIYKLWKERGNQICSSTQGKAVLSLMITLYLDPFDTLTADKAKSFFQKSSFLLKRSYSRLTNKNCSNVTSNVALSSVTELCDTLNDLKTNKYISETGRQLFLLSDISKCRSQKSENQKEGGGGES